MKRKGWETHQSGEEMRLAYHRPDDWWWVIQTTDLVNACGERDAVQISGNKRWTIMAELSLIAGKKNLTAENVATVMSAIGMEDEKEPNDKILIEATIAYGKVIPITTVYAAKQDSAVAKILSIKDIDLDGDLSPWFNKIVNRAGMTGLELLHDDVESAIKRAKQETETRTIHVSGNASTRTVSHKDMTGECLIVQTWGLDRCKDCEYRNDKECGGKRIRMTGRNSKGIAVPIPDGKVKSGL